MSGEVSTEEGWLREALGLLNKVLIAGRESQTTVYVGKMSEIEKDIEKFLVLVFRNGRSPVAPEKEGQA